MSRILEAKRCQVKDRVQYRISADRVCVYPEEIEGTLDSASSLVGIEIGRFFLKHKPRNPIVEWNIEISEVAGEFPAVYTVSSENITYHVKVSVAIWHDGHE